MPAGTERRSTLTWSPPTAWSATLTVTVSVARSAPSTRALTVNVCVPSVAPSGAVIVSWKGMSRGAVKGPYGVGGVKLTHDAYAAGSTRKVISRICRACSVTRFRIRVSRLSVSPRGA